MKVLTIKEPWASLIINGYKEYEFRSFKTNYRGKILIHAGLTLEKNNAIKFNNYNLDYGHGEIIGEAYITDCILVDDEFENKLEHVIKYNKRISCKGKLGLWNFDIDN